MKLTIGQLGKSVGISAKAIRFYEDIGLIDPATRAENGYRMYDDSIVEELQLIKYARDLGLPIEEIKKLMTTCEDGKCIHMREKVQEEVGHYLKLLNEKIAQLTTLQSKMETLHSNLNDDNCTHDKNCCNVLHQLSQLEKGGEKNGREK